MGSSGGAATALALYCIEKADMHGVLHTATREDKPYLNHTVMSRTRADLLATTGSRYAPASPCEGLGRIASAPGPCVFIGKPCDVAGAQKLRQLQPDLAANLGLTIAFFCAGTPSTQGTLDLLAHMGVDDPASITSLRYRGNGWPGKWTVTYRDDGAEEHTASMSYEDSWGFLQRYRQWRCYICPDHTGELADIAVGDPWYRQVEPGEAGKSLIVARTARGVKLLHAAAAAGYISLESNDETLLPRSQPNLLNARGRLWGQLVTLRALNVPHPRYSGFALFPHWRTQLSVKEKAQSFYGTLKRVFRKKLYRRQVTQ
jgi:coenzyme F420 hydrogenase subunit beta